MEEAVLVPVCVHLKELANANRFGFPLSSVLQPAIDMVAKDNKGKPLGLAILNTAEDADSVPSFSPEFIAKCNEIFHTLKPSPVEYVGIPEAPQGWPEMPAEKPVAMVEEPWVPQVAVQGGDVLPLSPGVGVAVQGPVNVEVTDAVGAW